MGNHLSVRARCRAGTPRARVRRVALSTSFAAAWGIVLLAAAPTARAQDIRDGLVVHDVHGDNRTIHLRTDGHDIADHIGIVRRLMRPIVLPEVPAIRERQPEQHDHESIEDIPGAPGLASRVA